jgi:hypothetical protein
MYANITLDTVDLDTPNKMAVLSQMFQLNAHQQSVNFQIRTSLPFSDYSTWTAIQHIYKCTDTSISECNQKEKHSVLPIQIISI